MVRSHLLWRGLYNLQSAALLRKCEGESEERHRLDLGRGASPYLVGLNRGSLFSWDFDAHTERK
jgi:hypothetical protein